jgi:predicted DCC family thiol-disulfide oxidoreductase YuxK
VLRELGGPWRAAGALRILPTRLLDAMYDAVARRRYRWFGRVDRCSLPTPEWRRRSLGPEP